MRWWHWLLLIAGLVALAGGASPIFILSIYVVVYFWKGLQRWSNGLAVARGPYFFFLSIIFSGITQILVQIAGEHSFSPNPVIHFFQALVIYLCVTGAWYLLLRRYQFTVNEVFVLTGLWGVIFENNFIILLSFNPLLWVYIFAVYGACISLPYLLTSEKFGERPRPSGWVRIVGVFVALTLALYASKIILILLGLAGLR